MKQSLRMLMLIMTLMFSSTSILASPDVDVMTDIEVSEYAIRMSNVLEKIRRQQLCVPDDMRCVHAEFTRHGISYTDKESVVKRLSIMLGSIH